jgi:hypothetical protein
MSNTNRYEKRLRFAGVCLVMGLLVEAICLHWATPIAFIVFVVVGGLLMFLGLVVYLNSQLSTAVARE